MKKQLEIDFSVIDKEIAEITKKENCAIDEKEALLNFKAILNKKPTKAMLKKNSFYGNMYIPLEISERVLSALFISYSFIMRIPPTIEDGNIIFYMDTDLIHPITNEKITYTGVSSVPIKPINGTLRDSHPHIPAAKSFAIMNSIKHIGRLFRAENDNITNIFDTYFDKPEEKVEVSEEDKAKSELKKRFLTMIDVKLTVASLDKLGKQVDEIGDTEVTKAFNTKRKELNKKPKKKK